jgi:hypothetical protein
MAVTARAWGVLGVSGGLEPLFISMGHSYVLLVLQRDISLPSRFGEGLLGLTRNGVAPEVIFPQTPQSRTDCTRDSLHRRKAGRQNSLKDYPAAES